MGGLKGGYQISGRGHPAGFCWLCWKFSEEREAGIVVEKCIGAERKIERPNASAQTIHDANQYLKNLIAASEIPAAQFTLEELLYSFIPSFDYRNKGSDSPELLVEIEKEIINREWYNQILKLDENGLMMDVPDRYKIRRLSVNPINICLDQNPNRTIKVIPSRSFCSNHNPKRSIEARRFYQNDRKRIPDLEKEINRLYHYTYPSFGLDSDEDLQALLKEAYNNVFTSTLDRIQKLKAEGMKQTEIANILGITRQAVSNALRREKRKTL